MKPLSGLLQRADAARRAAVPGAHYRRNEERWSLPPLRGASIHSGSPVERIDALNTEAQSLALALSGYTGTLRRATREIQQALGALSSGARTSVPDDLASQRTAPALALLARTRALVDQLPKSHATEPWSDRDLAQVDEESLRTLLETMRRFNGEATNFLGLLSGLRGLIRHDARWHQNEKSEEPRVHVRIPTAPGRLFSIPRSLASRDTFRDHVVADRAPVLDDSDALQRVARSLDRWHEAAQAVLGALSVSVDRLTTPPASAVAESLFGALPPTVVAKAGEVLECILRDTQLPNESVFHALMHVARPVADAVEASVPTELQGDPDGVLKWLESPQASGVVAEAQADLERILGEFEGTARSHDSDETGFLVACGVIPDPSDAYIPPLRSAYRRSEAPEQFSVPNLYWGSIEEAGAGRTGASAALGVLAEDPDTWAHAITELPLLSGDEALNRWIREEPRRAEDANRYLLRCLVDILAGDVEDGRPVRSDEDMAVEILHFLRTVPAYSEDKLVPMTEAVAAARDLPEGDMRDGAMAELAERFLAYLQAYAYNDKAFVQALQYHRGTS